MGNLCHSTTLQFIHYFIAIYNMSASTRRMCSGCPLPVRPTIATRTVYFIRIYYTSCVLKNEPGRGDDGGMPFQNVQGLTLKIYITDYQSHGMEKMQAKPPTAPHIYLLSSCSCVYLFFYFTLQSTHSIYVTLE